MTACAVDSPIRFPRDAPVATGVSAAALLAFLVLLLSPVVLNPLRFETGRVWTIECAAFAAVVLVANAGALGCVWRTTVFDRLLCAYVACVVLTWPTSVDRSATGAALASLVVQLAVYAAVRTLAARWAEAPRVTIAALVVGIAWLEWRAIDFHLGVGLAERLVDFPLEWNGREGLGLVAAIQFGIALGAWHWNRSSRRLQLASMVVIAAVVVELLFLYSRLAWIAAAAVTAAGLITATQAGGMRRYAALAVVALAIVVAVSTPYMAHLASLAVGVTAPRSGDESGLAWRAAAWLDALRVIARHPLVGVGLENYATFRRSVALPRAVLLGDPTPAVHPHNLFLQRTAELGVAGGAVHIALWATALWAGWRIATRRGAGTSVTVNPSLFYALVAIVVANLGENMFDIAAERARLQTIAWVVIACIVAEWSRRPAEPVVRAIVPAATPRRLLAAGCAVLAAYEVCAVFLFHTPALVVQGQHVQPAAAFGDGVRFTQAFQMQGNGLNAVDVQFASDGTQTVWLRCELSPFQPLANDALPYEAVAVYRWLATIKRIHGVEWRQLSFPPLEQSDGRMYVLRLELIKATEGGPPDGVRVPSGDALRRPAVMVSTDNVFGGGSLWIGDRRQVGSLSFRAWTETRTAYRRWRADRVPQLPPVARPFGVDIAAAVAYQLAVLTLIQHLFGKFS